MDIETCSSEEWNHTILLDKRRKCMGKQEQQTNTSRLRVLNRYQVLFFFFRDSQHAFCSGTKGNAAKERNLVQPSNFLHAFFKHSFFGRCCYSIAWSYAIGNHVRYLTFCAYSECKLFHERCRAWYCCSNIPSPVPELSFLPAPYRG